MKDNPSIFEWIVFAVFVLLEIVLFGLGVLNPAAVLDQTQNLLYNAFQVAFSLYIGYFIQKIDSARQFRESLKQYGLSAYRRIIDIRKSIDRTIVQISRIGVNYPKDKTNDLDALRLILEGTFDTVESSIADWGEIIGPEIRKKEEAEIIQEKIIERQDKIDLSEEDKRTIAELRTQLARINSELPLALRKEADLMQKAEREKESLYGHHFEYVINRDKCLTLYVEPQDNNQKLTNNGPYFIVLFDVPDGRGHACFVLDKDKHLIGRILDSITPQGPIQRYYFNEILILLTDMGFLPAERKMGEQSIMYSLSELKYIGTTPDGSQIIMQLPVQGYYAPRG